MEEEKLTKPSNYLLSHFQPLIKPKMRVILLDWISQVSQDLNLMRETFYLAVSVVDRYLSCQVLNDLKDLQLIGLTALIIACKIEEIRPPSIYKMLGFCLNAYDDATVRSWELQISKVGLSQIGSRLDSSKCQFLHLDWSCYE